MPRVESSLILFPDYPSRLRPKKIKKIAAPSLKQTRLRKEGLWFINLLVGFFSVDGRRTVAKRPIQQVGDVDSILEHRFDKHRPLWKHSGSAVFRHRTLVWRAVAFWTPKRWVSVKVCAFCQSALFVFQTPPERIKDHYCVQTCCVIMGLHSTPAQTILFIHQSWTGQTASIFNFFACCCFVLCFVVVLACLVVVSLHAWTSWHC